jgi:hypothetical protein
MNWNSFNHVSHRPNDKFADRNSKSCWAAIHWALVKVKVLLCWLHPRLSMLITIARPCEMTLQSFGFQIPSLLLVSVVNKLPFYAVSVWVVPPDMVCVDLWLLPIRQRQRNNFWIEWTHRVNCIAYSVRVIMSMMVNRYDILMWAMNHEETQYPSCLLYRWQFQSMCIKIPYIDLIVVWTQNPLDENPVSYLRPPSTHFLLINFLDKIIRLQISFSCNIWSHLFPISFDTWIYSCLLECWKLFLSKVIFLDETSELYKILVNVIHTENKYRNFHTLKNLDKFIFTLYLLYSTPEIQNFYLFTWHV